MAVENSDNIRYITQQSENTQTDYHDDEISLIDLWLTLVKHRKLLAIVCAASILIGVLFALTKPKVYTYTTSIEIARGVSGLIEQPETVLAKLNESYIPFIRNQLENTNSSNQSSVGISAKIPKNSEIIVLESKGTEGLSDVHQDVHKLVISKIAIDHDRTIAVMKRGLEAEQRQARNKSSELQDQAEFLKTQEQRLGENAKLLKAQIIDVRNLIAESRKNRKLAVNEVTGEAKAMTLLLIDNEIQQYQKRLSELEEHLAIGLENDRDELHKSLADNLRAQDDQQQRILETSAKISEIKATQSITPTMQSFFPVGTSGATIVMLSVIVGFMIGFMIIFIIEFLAKAKDQTKLKYRTDT